MTLERVWRQIVPTVTDLKEQNRVPIMMRVCY